MKKLIRITSAVISLSLVFLLMPGCSEEKWDIDEQGIPQFVNDNFIEVNKISRISKFRSSAGHDYSDSYEQCRSMKHYFQPGVADWTTVKIYSPVSGTIKKLDNEWAGTQIHIVSDEYPAFKFIIFHVNLSGNPEVGDKVTAGEQIGTHSSQETMSDIAVEVQTTFTKRTLISYFEVLTDYAFLPYSERGVSVRGDFIISKADRDAHPLRCNGETFENDENYNAFESWVSLE